MAVLIEQSIEHAMTAIGIGQIAEIGLPNNGFILARHLLRIPAQVGQRFQPKLDSDSKASWTLIPAQPGQLKVIT